MPNITQVIFPNTPHLDPIAAFWLLRAYGEATYPGVGTAKVEVWKASAAPDEAALKQWADDGVLSFDITGGTFDHHGTDKTVTLLVAEALGIQDNAELQWLLRYVQEDDMAGLHNLYGDLAGVVKAFYKRGDGTEDVIKFVLNVLEALQAKERAWHIGAKDVYGKTAKLFRVKRNKNTLKLVVLLSDNLDVANYAKQEENAAVVIQKNSLGYVYIFTNAFFRINLRDIVAVVRLRELEEQGKQLRPGSDLRKPGKLMEVQNWFYHDALNALMNGSAALSDTPPTKLSIEEIVEIVVFGLSTEAPTEEDGPEAQQHFMRYQQLFGRAR